MVTKVWVVQWGRQWLEQKHFEDHFDQTWVAESEGWVQGAAVTDLEIMEENEDEELNVTVMLEIPVELMRVVVVMMMKS